MDKPALSARIMGYAQADKRLDILRLVGMHGSISQAAREAGVSYKAAWQAVHTLTNLAGEPLVDSSVGGSGGGGARLTPAGERMLEAASQMAKARSEVLARFNDPAEAPVLAGPRTSMRNHLPCQVVRLESDGARDPMVRVVLSLPPQYTLASLITRESCELLALESGQWVLVLCKATAVQVVPPDAAASTDGVNRLAGKVMRVARGVQRDEAIVALHGGQQVVGFASRPNTLKSGSRALVQLDEAAVVLALPG